MLNIVANGPSGYNLTNSLRFRASASAYLSRTPASAGNRQTWTASFWIKKGALGTSPRFFSTSDLGSNDFAIDFSGDSLELWGYVSAAVQLQLVTTAVYRDPSAWYHIVVAIDTTQATSSNRAKIYVNGSQVTAFSTATYPAQNTSFLWNSTAAARIGIYQTGSSAFDGYMAEMYFIDGQALTPSSFGSTNATTGVWQPAQYTGTYGTNGFYLKFSDIALTSGSNAGLGKDFSGNGNYWNTNNISVTAGTTYDAMSDVPTLTSPTVANYCVLNATIRQGSGSVTEGNLKGAGSSYECWGTIAFPSTGKYYFEYTQNGSTGAGNGPAIGIVGLNPPDENYGVKYNRNGTKWLNGTNSIAYGASYTTNDVIGVAYDADNNSVVFYKNNVSQGATTTTSGYTYLPYQFDNSGNGGFLNFGQRPFTYTPPTGFVALNTFNLPNSTVVKGNTVMDATLYTGTGSSLTITNAGGFKPDFVWGKKRSAVGDNILIDSVVGGNPPERYLSSNTTSGTTANADVITSLNSNGFTVGTSGALNASAATYVGWQWQAGQGSTSSNTSGSITSTVSVNTTAGFSIVTYTGNGTYPSTIGHGLGVAPKWIITKTRNAVSNWRSYHSVLGAGSFMEGLNNANAAFSSSTIWNNTSPTSTVFTVGSADVNGNGTTYVAYCWAEIAGFSKFGSYTGNASSDGVFVYTGFRPKYLMIKISSASNWWYMYDSSRSPYNTSKLILYANQSDAEATSSTSDIDFLSNGFKLRGADSGVNGSGTYIYMAFAENPFKNALAR